MPLIRKRRAPQPEDDPESSSAEEEQVPQRGNQRRRNNDTPQDDSILDDADAGGGGYGEGAGQTNGVQPLARKLCRYALSCEYSRQPIRRADIGAKVLSNNAGRSFKGVFTEAQDMLRDVFGMEMAELPVRDKVTLQQKRAAQKQDKPATSSNAWILVSTLPPKYRQPDIIPPPSVPTSEAEAAYVGFYTFLLSTIYLAGGSLPESKLERYLRRLNADRNTPMGQKDKLLQRMIKEQYLVKVIDRGANEEQVEYMVGPRGKMEVGEEGVAGLVRSVYGNAGREDLEKRLDRSLGISAARYATKNGEADGTGTDGAVGATGQQNGRRKSRREKPGRQREESEEDEDEEGQSSEEDEE